MRLTKGQLKRIIREEYSRLKRRGLIREAGEYVSDDGQDCTIELDIEQYAIDVDLFLDYADEACDDMGYPRCKIVKDTGSVVHIRGPKGCLWEGWVNVVGDDVEFFESSCM